MKVNILASGSGGNCIALRTGQTTILVDAGIAKTKIEKALLEVDIKPTDINAIFVTHAHKDHTKGLPIANKYRITVYAGVEEWKDINGIDEELRETVYDGCYLDCVDCRVVPFDASHDAYQPLGYTIQSKKGKVSILLDTGHVSNHMSLMMQNSNIYIIEANHDPNMVEASAYPNSVKARILSDIGHLSNQQTAEALYKLIQGRGEQIYLTHLSSNNNLPALAELTVKRALAKKGFNEGEHYHLEVIE